MNRYDEKLSAYLDGELPAEEAREIEIALEADPELRAALESLVQADALARQDFDAMLDEPVPVALAAAIRDAPGTAPANLTSRPRMSNGLIAAGLLLALLIGGTGGYFKGLSEGAQIASAPGWLSDIADYHRVYAGQTRHLVEVGADEADHIETWLTATVGADVRIPDLSEHALTFRGARLLVAAGKPVAQLMFTDADERVVALCLIQSATPRHGFAQRTIDTFDMVSWGGTGANLVVVGDEGRGDLDAIARTAAAQT